MAWTTPGTAVAGDVLTASFWNSNVRDNLAELANLADGTAWETWTPASRSGVTIGNGTEVGRYVRVGRLCVINYLLTLGSTSAITGDFVLQLPFNNARQHACSAMVTDYLTLDYHALGFLTSNNVIVRAINTSGTYAYQAGFSATVPFTWATNDVVNLTAVYETAT